MGISDDIVPGRSHRNRSLNSDDLFVVHEKTKDENKSESDESSIAVEIKNDSPKASIDSGRLEQLKNDFFKSPESFTKTEPKKPSPKAQPSKSTKGSSPKSKKVYRLLTILLILIIACIVAWQYWYQSNKGKSAKLPTVNTNTNLETYANDVVPQDYTSTVNANINSTVTTPIANTNQAVAPDKSTIKINLLNGNGIKNSATSVKSTLVAAGFKISNVANAKNFAYPKTEIYYNTGKVDDANLVKAALSSRTTELVESADIAGKYDVVIVIGKL